MEKNVDIFKEMNKLEQDVASVTNWILGPADSMLNAHYQIGFDVASSEELRREHEKLELECRETYGKYAKLLHKIDSMSSNYVSHDLKCQRDFMDFVCRSFATRLERRRNVLIVSQRFFRLVSEYFDKTSEVFDKLIMRSRMCNLSNAEIKLLKLEKSQLKLEGLERELIKEGEKLSDILSMPVKDALCRDVQINYCEDIINIRDIMDAAYARTNIFNDSVELQKLALKQITLIHTYENDAQQAIYWLNDLFDVLIGNHIQIGCNITEIQIQKEEHQSFQDTARGTYEYGCQMISGARVLRISCNLDLLSNTTLLSRLRNVWRQLRSVSQDQLIRLRVCAVFHRNIVDYCMKLREMIATVRLFLPKRSRSATSSISSNIADSPTSFLRPKPEIRRVLGKREKLLPEIGRMVRLGRLLRSRLKEPFTYRRTPDFEETDHSNNQSAVQSISEKLLEVTRLAEKLDTRLCEAGARTKLLDSTVDEATKQEQNLSSEKRSETLEVSLKNIIKPIEEYNNIIAKNSNIVEYITAIECSSTSVPRSRSESYPSSEYGDTLNSTTCWSIENESVKKNNIISEEKCETILSINLCDQEYQESINDYNPDNATVTELTIKDTSLVTVETRMVNGYETLDQAQQENNRAQDLTMEAQSIVYKDQSIVLHVIEKNSKTLVTAANPRPAPKMTTIGTIALQSGGTQLVIAILESGEYLKLQILDAQPELTKLGISLEEAKELLNAHNEVVFRLQSKPSPVEELLKKADGIISMQKSKAEICKTIAETLTIAWKDVNEFFERRKKILERNVLFHCRTRECKESMSTLETICNDTVLPIEIELVKHCLRKIHELRKTMLETLMGALKAGKLLLDRLYEITNEGTLYSRPEKIKAEAENAIYKVEGWLEALHDKRHNIELSFRNKKAELEQCLAFALLASDLRKLEHILNTKIIILSNNNDNLGDSSASAQILLFELKKLQTEAMDFQDKAIKITKSTEHQVSSRHFASEHAIEQAYAILALANDYINDLDQYEVMLNRAIAFFDSARSVYTKLDQLEIQLATTEHLVYSPELARLHSQSVKTLEEITATILLEGRTLLEITGGRAPGLHGIKRTVEEIEDRKIKLLERCTAHREENIRISRYIRGFMIKYEELSIWLSSIVEAFLRGHQDMGSNFPLARDFYKLHMQLLEDLCKRSEEIHQLDGKSLPNDILKFLEKSECVDIFDKIKALKNSWNRSRTALEIRLQLALMYMEFHQSAYNLEGELDKIEEILKESDDNMSEVQINNVERNWTVLQNQYFNFTTQRKKFLEESTKIVDSYLDIPRACLCIESILEKYANRQFNVTQKYKNFVKTLSIQEELRIEQEKRREESKKTIQCVLKLRENLYPIITCESTKPIDILNILQNSKTKIFEINKAITELDYRMKSFEETENKNEDLNIELKKKLSEVSESLQLTSSNYKSLLDNLISIFEKLLQVEQEINTQQTCAKFSSTLNNESVHEVRVLLDRLHSFTRSTLEIFEQIKQKSEKIIVKVKNLEPSEAANQDIDKLDKSFKLVINFWNTYSIATKSRLQERLDLSCFGDDLDKINVELHDLTNQLETITRWLTESLSTAKKASETFLQFEKTLNILSHRIEKFIINTKISAVIQLPNIQKELTSLQDKELILKNLTEDTRQKVNLSIEYFELLEEVKEWFKEGNELLIVLARKAIFVKIPEDASILLGDIDTFLKSGEELQEKRIQRIKELSTKIFGTDRLPQFSDLVVENREMLDSFTIISSELRTIMENLYNVEDTYKKMYFEQEDTKINEARIEVNAAQTTVADAVIRVVETLETAADEASEIALLEDERNCELKKIRQQIAERICQKEATNESDTFLTNLINETVTKEVHIMQKTETTEGHIFTIKQEQEPIIESTKTNKAIMSREQKFEITPITDEIFIKPEFTVPLNDATIQEGEKFIFECCIIGHPRPIISWHKDGIPIVNNPDYLTKYNDNGLCTLMIEESFIEDSAKFSCKATNKMGSSQSEAVLTVKETSAEEKLNPPLFVKALSSFVVNENYIHQLECKVQGNPLPTVQWFKNNVNIDNSPDYVTTYNNGEAILKFEDIGTNDEGIFMCKATNRIGQAATSTTLTIKSTTEKEQINIIEAPKIIVSPLNMRKVTGEKFILECITSGTAPFEFFWTHEGKHINEDKQIKICKDVEAGKCNLVVLEAYSKDEGKYEVTVRNAAGEAKANCDVTVKVKELFTESTEQKIPPIRDMNPKVPKIQLPLKDLAIIEGASSRLDCVIIGQPEPEVIWYHDDKPVKESADFQLLFQGDRCSLVIHETFLDDAGIYKVVAINTGGEASSKCTLTVTPKSLAIIESAPKFLKLLTDLLVAEEEEAVFECIVNGEPKPTVIWQFNGEVLIENERIKIIVDEDGRNFLKISPSTPEDKGNYTAKATNYIGEAKSFAKLIVKFLGDFQHKDDVVQMEEKFMSPYFKEKFENRIVPEGTTTKFECIVVGKPSPKIQWLFNEKPIHGKDFLISVSGNHQVLTISKVNHLHEGNICCTAENTIGKAVCEANIEIGGGVTVGEGNIESIQALNETIKMQASNSSNKFFTSEKTTGEGGLSDNQTMTKTSSVIESSTTHTMKKEYVTTTSSSTFSSSPLHPISLCEKKSSQSSQQSNTYNGAPPIIQSQKIEEYERIVQDTPNEIRQENTIITTEDSEGTRKKECKHQIQIQKPCRKQTAPRFVSPITGMIVDQGSNIVLEGIVDGFPQPIITWTKNGQELLSSNGLKVNYDHNHVKLEINDIKIKDAGRYTCTARNEVGNSSSTADLVVKKTIFPPVFGRRLQAQVVKKGDRVIMEVEITGTPEPTVTWYKDDEPLIESECRMKQQGNCYILFIDKAEKVHAGKYMVQATNAGGEAQSIADFAVFDPTPDTMIETHKTMIYDNVQDKNARKPCCGQSTEIPGANLTSEQITTTMIQPSATIKTPFPSTSSSSTIRTIKSEVTNEYQKASRSEMISSAVESHKSETKSEQKFHMKLEHKPAPVNAEGSDKQEKTNVINHNSEIKSELNGSENVETSSMAHKDAISFFEAMSKKSNNLSKEPKEIIKLTDEDDGTGPGCEVRVNQLSKNYERSTKFEEITHEVPKPDIQAGKKVVQEIFNKFEKGSSSRGIDNTMFNFPYEEHKLTPLQCTRTVLEDVTASGSPIHGTLTISKLQAQSESAEEMLKGFNLVPEPPPEIVYAPNLEELTKKRQDISIKAKQLQESFANYNPVDAPIGGIKIFPSSCSLKIQPKTLENAYMYPLNVSPPFELSKSEVIEEMDMKKNSGTFAGTLGMEKSWSHKNTDSNRKSCPPQEQKTSFTDKQEWSFPEQNYKVSSSESKQEIELKPEYRCTQTTIESSSSLEKKSYGSKEIYMSEEKIISPPSLPKSKPIIYNAETIKVDHTINTVEEKSLMEKYVSEYDIHKIETEKKKYEATKKQTARPWPNENDLRAPALVRNVSEYSKPTIKLYHQTSIAQLQPGTPPEIACTSESSIYGKKTEKMEKCLEKSFDHKPAFISTEVVKTILPSSYLKQTQEYISKDCKVNKSILPSQQTDLTTKYLRSSFYNESDYESDSTLKSKWQFYKSDTGHCASGYRKVKAPVSMQHCRPKSTESESVPSSSFEVLSTNLDESTKPIITPNFSQSSIEKSCLHYQKDSTQYQERSNQSHIHCTLPKPGSPPVYVQSMKFSTKTFKPESPKFKTKVFHQESGYMADTDEPLYLQQHKSFSESKSNFIESKSFNSSQQKKDNLLCSSKIQSYSSTPKTITQRTSFVEKITEKSPQLQYRSTSSKDKSQMSASSSRYSKGEFRESDYESDYDSGKISSLWKPEVSTQTLSDTKSSSSSSIKSVKASLSTTGKTSAPPLSFTETMKKSIAKRENIKNEKSRSKSVLLPGSPPELAYAPRRQSFYEGRSGLPYHNAIGTEMKKTVHMNESTENSRRIITVEQTNRIIKFGKNQHETQCSIEETSNDEHKTSCYNVPTPMKFVRGHFRESDYESDIDARIRVKWAPSESETEEPQYRKVQPPKGRTCRTPIITCLSESTTEKSEIEKQSIHIKSMSNRQISEHHELKPGSPPEFGYAPAYDFKKTANHVATKHINDMTSSFKSKTAKLSNNIQFDLKKRSKPILKTFTPTDGKSVTDGRDEPRTYREESRVAQYGTKHIDPDTGLIYFKYDFGYEFGIVLPAQGKSNIISNDQTYNDHRKTGDVEVPIVHELTSNKENGVFKQKNSHNFSRKSTVKLGKTVKWEPTSESEFSEAEDLRGLGQKVSISPNLLMPATSTLLKWDPISSSPASLSPSLPSLSSHFEGGPPSNNESTPGSPWSLTNVERIIPVATEVVKPYIEILQQKAPQFITPLRDIAVVNGQMARFECIVQAEPQPYIIWSKDGRIVNNSINAEVYYRNGVCRLTLPRTTLDDAGTYTCTATNDLDSTVTSASLQVPGNRRSIFGI